jgi:pyruvate/2-oxoglutarate dehydrogenase complex dihydrolipoamide acyltransferase (E2) component
MTSSPEGKDPVASVRRFPGIDEFNAAANDARLTPLGLTLPHTELGGGPVGTRLALDWRLESGTPLVLGYAELVEITGPRATLRVVELDPSCRIARLFAGEIGRPVEPLPVASDQDDTVVGLVERTYRNAGGAGRAGRPSAPFSEVFLPPEPAPPASAPAPSPAPEARPRPAPELAAPAAPPSAPMAPLQGREPRSHRGWKAAAVLVAATGLGFGARFSFARLEPIVAEMLSDAPAVDEGTLDVPPAGVRPSTLPPPAAAPEPAATPPAPVAPADAAATALVPESAPQAVERPLDRLRSIRWEREGEATVVILRGNGSAHAERLLHTRLDAPQPRELLKVRGVDLPFQQSALTVGTPELQRIRIGFHPRPVANELHIVLDLPDHRVALTDILVDGQTYRLVLSRKR